MRRRDVSHDCGISTGKRQTLCDMDALALGVEAQLDPLSAYSSIIIQRTTIVAQSLGISKSEIDRWMTRQRVRESSKRKAITALNSLLPEEHIAERS